MATVLTITLQSRQPHSTKALIAIMKGYIRQLVIKCYLKHLHTISSNIARTSGVLSIQCFAFTFHILSSRFQSNLSALCSQIYRKGDRKAEGAEERLRFCLLTLRDHHVPVKGWKKSRNLERNSIAFDDHRHKKRGISPAFTRHDFQTNYFICCHESPHHLDTFGPAFPQLRS